MDRVNVLLQINSTNVHQQDTSQHNFVDGNMTIAGTIARRQQASKYIHHLPQDSPYVRPHLLEAEKP